MSKTAARAAKAAPPAPSAPPDDAQLTPAMRQYAEQKRQVGDALLLFRMGDFYELFYDDAAVAARLLGITLTTRDGRTPMAGIPHHALESYLARLVAAGQRIAISEQIEDARQAKGVVQRAIARVVTPGTLTDEALLDRTTSNVLAAVTRGQADATSPLHAEVGLALLELSTGELIVQRCRADRLLDEIGRAAPAEVLLPEPPVGRDELDESIREQLGVAVTYRSPADFQPRRAEQLLREQFETAGLEGFGFSAIDVSLQAAGALLAYVRETQRSSSRHIRPPRRRAVHDHLELDAVTLRSLEIERTLRGGTRSGSLLAAVDRTSNPMGARLLRQWLCFPLREIGEIERRQRTVGVLRSESRARAALRRILHELGDVERILGRLGVQRASPRDLRGLGNGLARLAPLRALLSDIPGDGAPGHPADYAARLAGLDPLAERLTGALRPDAAPTLREGGIFNAGIHPELDRLRDIGTDGQRWLAEYQAALIQRSGIPNLKVGFNRVFGYYIEVSNAQRDRVPEDFVRRQTVKTAERYVTDELKRFESDVLSADSRANELEYEMFCALRDEVAAHIPALQVAGGAIAELDVLTGWAELSSATGWCRPEFVDSPLLEIEAGRHPVVEQSLGASFVANDATLAARTADAALPDSPRPDFDESAPTPGSTGIAHGAPALALITGPNMAGKSTYIRQVALLTLLAHCGCWTPAARMRLGLVDRIFTRVGAADELARGQSTFMVEMIETASILHNATRHSLVILDEVGRGTSTYDGLALAWAITEHLANAIGCRALFATHYHELTELADLLDGVGNLNVAVREFEDQVVFLHRIVPGAADRSYGLHVAKLAGVPRSVLERANNVLNELEKAFDREARRPVLAAAQRRRQRQLRLFEEPEETVVRELREWSPEAHAGTDAVGLLARWRKLLGLAPGPAS